MYRLITIVTLILFVSACASNGLSSMRRQHFDTCPDGTYEKAPGVCDVGGANLPTR